MVALSNLEASSSLPPSSSSATPNGEYHVFISFRGKDTRNSFVSHLYQALFQRGIKTFKDDEELKKGEHIKELLTAIEKSRFSIVVFSEDFASSRWCLDEVEKIVDCVSSREQTVLPVFYHINPTDVRHQKGSFKDAFAKHEERNKEDSGKVQRWRSALTEVADRSGYTSWDGPESVVIQKIVEQISTKLNLTFLHIDERLVGINNRVEKILLLLDMESKHDVRYIGIHGMGGMGKTAAAKVVYNQIFRQFEGSSYLANIREHSKQHGLPSLQKQLLSEILGKGNLDIPNVDKGNPIIKQRLPYKRVLIILDDVDQSNQIEALAGKCDWFGSGSRIIITTRDARLLDLPEVNERHQVERYQVERYQVEQLSDNESLELFCEKAFKNDRPLKDFEDLSNEVVKYANGLPFALKFLGSYLFRRSISEWKSALKETPHIHIINMLIVSFDGLEELHKKIFLDVACFFKGQTKNEVMESLNSFGRDPQIGISTLVERSLISFFTVEVEWECEGEVLLPRVWMHNLVQEMGWHIVRQESQHEPGGRSRLWRLEDIFHVLANNTGTEAIETIMLPGNYIGSRHEGDIIPEVFLKMPRLRFLYLADILFSQGVTVLPNELRVLEWWEFPSESLPPNFHPHELVKLSLHGNCIKQLWKGAKAFQKLLYLDLSCCYDLTEVPDLSGSPNLEFLNLLGCTKLLEVHPSVSELKKLKRLNLYGCGNLITPACSIDLPSLQYFNLSGCSKLKKFPEIQGIMKCLQQLYLGRTPIIELPSSIRNLTALSYLDLAKCKNLLSLPGSICELTSLQKLFLDSCSMLECLPGNMGNLKSLTKLNLSNCNKLSSLPGNIFEMTSLQELFLDNCSTLEYLPGNIGNLKSLTKLGLSNCKNLLSLPSSISELTSLQALPELPSDTKEIEASGCTSLKRLWKNNIPVEFKGGILLDSNNCFQMGMNEQSVIDVLQRIQFQAVDSFDICLPGNDIPEWFSHQRQSIGSSLSVPLPSNWHTSNLIMGFLYCALGGEFFPQKKICLVAEITVDDNIIIASSKDSVGDSRVGYWKKDKGKCHMWLGYRSLNFLECSNDHVPGREGINTELKISLSSTSTKWVDITRCGVHLVYKLQG